MIRVALPYHLATLAATPRVIALDLGGATTVDGLIDALESAHPTLVNTVRDLATGRRRPFIRFFVDEDDLSNEGPDCPLPRSVVEGSSVFHVVGAMAGG